MTETHTLTEFLQNTGARISLYDMGRRVVKIPVEDFLEFEKTNIPYPLPLQNQAWFGISMLDKSVSDEPVIWFLRLPLDEQGKLIQATRDYFLQRLIEVAIDRQSGKETDAFKDNPYTFKPREERLAIFHAKLARELNRAPSRFFSYALDYFNGKPGWDQWSFVGYQGIADIAAAVSDPEITTILEKAIPSLPEQPLTALCHCLENEPICKNLSTALLNRLDREMKRDQPNTATITALIRGISCSADKSLKNQMAQRCLSSSMSGNIEVLAALSGRAWELLTQPEIAKLFMESLAINDHGQEAFNQCLLDLLSVPDMKPHVLAAVRDPERSDELAEAFAEMTRQIHPAD